MSNELTDEELLCASEEDWAFYNKCIEGLPTREGFNGNYWDKNGHEIPWGSGPHILKYFRETYELVKPKGILEIGLCLGAGASMWLNIGNVEVVSIDISDREETVEAGNILRKRYPMRFRYAITHNPIEHLKGVPFDLCWLDGGHEEEDVTRDIELCKELKIPYILGDDFYFRFGPGVQKAFDKFPEMELIKDMNNLKLYKTNF